MKRIRNGQQEFADQVKKEPGGQYPQRALPAPKQSGEAEAADLGGLGQFPEALGADQAVIVFGNTFTTKVVPTVGAAGDGLPSGVIQAALEKEIGHKLTMKPGCPPRPDLGLAQRPGRPART